MKVLQVIEAGKSLLIDMPVPQPGPGQVLIKVLAVTTCPQWDLHLKNNQPMFVGHQFHYPYTPGQPGHEAAGLVAAVGPDVKGFQPGDLVCAWKDAGHAQQGCYAQYVLHEADHVLAVPASLEAEDAAALELAMCVAAVFLMLEEMGGIKDHTVAVSGLGPAGLVAVQMARAAGAGEVIGFDFNPKRQALALKLGASQVFHPEQSPWPVRPEQTAITTAIDCVGSSQSVEFLMDRTEKTVALFGVQRENYTYAPRHYNKLRLCGYQGHSKEAAIYALDLLTSKKLDLRSLITHHLPLKEYDRGLELLASQEAIKVCFYPWD